MVKKVMQATTCLLFGFLVVFLSGCGCGCGCSCCSCKKGVFVEDKKTGEVAKEKSKCCCCKCRSEAAKEDKKMI